MELQQLTSEMLAARKAGTAQQLYTEMTATALDFRTLAVPDDWLEQLWDLAQDVRKLIPESVTLPEDQRRQMASDFVPNLEKMGVKLKSRPQKSREGRQKEVELDGLRKRHQQIRQNAWFDVKIGAVDTNVYRMDREEQSNILEDRLRRLEQLLPTPAESAQIARGYLDAVLLWRTLDRPSTTEERKTGLDSFSRARVLIKRTKRYYDERDRVVFLWEEPVIEADPAEVEEMRAELIKELEEMGVDAADI